MNEDALLAAVNTVFPMGPSAKFSWFIFSGDIGLQFLGPDKIEIMDDGTLAAKISIKADAQLSVQIWPLPALTFGPWAKATASLQLSTFVENKTVYVAPKSIPVVSLDFDMGTTESFLLTILKIYEALLVQALNAIIGPLIQDALKSIRISICTIPDIDFDLGQKKIVVEVESSKTGGFYSQLGSLLTMDLQLKASEKK